MSLSKGVVTTIAAGSSVASTWIADVSVGNPIDGKLISQMAIQIPLVILFAFFVFKMMDRFDRIIQLRDAAAEEAAEKASQNASAERALDRESWKRFNEALTDVSRAIDRNSVILFYHDATVRGVDPQAMTSQDELLRILRGKSAS